MAHDVQTNFELAIGTLGDHQETERAFDENNIMMTEDSLEFAQLCDRRFPLTRTTS